MNSDMLPDSQEGLDFQQFKARLISYWRKEAGSSVDRMLQDRTDAIGQLNHPDWRVRRTALSILQFHWRASKDADFAERCEYVGLHDVHPQVRSLALMKLGMCFENTNDLRIGKLLAQVVLDETQPSEAKRGPYLGLYYLRGRRFDVVGSSREPPRVSEDVDWSFVKSFFGG